ncbi:MAG: sensor domain-containing diguanylate cyclase [Pseudomonadales bacterium]|nr:sensor domain-containing diguanylate cyclase [Pseudomonadales bacterium]
MHERIDIPDATREAWQKTVDIMADIIGVPSALIMRVRDEQQLEVFVASRTPGNIFVEGETARRDSGLFCEHAMETGELLMVANAADDPAFSESPSTRRGMISYLGMPLLWPDGRPFGSICVMDSRENRYSARYERLLAQFQEIVSLHLALLFQQHELKERTRRDALTGACTRREFFEVGRAELKRARRYGHPLCLLIMDFDHFKQINDRYGHAAGDQVLKVLSRRIMDALRASDRYYRFGGEEFVIMLPHSEMEESLLVAERIRVLVETRPVEFGDLTIPVTLSIGMARLEGAGETLDDVVAKADRALYMAKEAGRNRVEIHERLRQAGA